MELEPDNVKFLNNLAWLLATCPDAEYRNGKKAVELSKKALGINHNPIYLDTLAAAYAEIGDFSKAIYLQNDVIRFLTDKTNISVIAECKKHLDSYKNNQPWRE